MNKLFNIRRTLSWGLCLLLQAIALVFFAQKGSAASPVDLKSNAHKIEVSNPILARKIHAQGGKLIADYGSFQLYEVQSIDPKWLANNRVQFRDEYDIVRLNTGPFNTRHPQVQALSKALGIFPGKRLHLVQFAGPIQPIWRNELLATGVQILSYIPENAYLVYGDSPSLAALQKLAAASSEIQWQAGYLDSYKIHPFARNVDAHGNGRTIGTDLFTIQMVDNPDANQSTFNLLDSLKLEPFKSIRTNLHYVNVIARLNANSLAKISAQPDVVSIQARFQPRQMCERQDQIVAGNLTNGIPSGPGYLAWLTNAGFTQAQFTASDFLVDIADSGIDNGTASPNHFGLYTGGSLSNASRIVYNRYESTVSYPNNTLDGSDGHGNLNAHIVGGYDDFSGFPFTDDAGFHFGLGVCPFVNIGSSVIFDSAVSGGFYYPNYNNLEAEAFRDGARISCNAWGYGGSSGVYDSTAQTMDALVRDAQPDSSSVPVGGNQPMIIVFAAGNDGPAGTNVDTPATAKNVICVGAADNVQPFGGADGLGVGDDQATNANEMFLNSSRGPCADGRAKPDLVAPGTHISGGVPQETNNFCCYPYGIADTNYTGDAIAGGPGGSLFWPTNQQFYTASSGTSQAAPAVAGGCALVYQYFINNFTNPPSPAMTKAFLMNSARYLTGATANDTLPSPAQGMGEMNLGTAFDGVPRILSDQDTNRLFTASGQADNFTGLVYNTNNGFRVTLAWSDAPGSTLGADWNNDLDLTVIVGGNSYHGNVFNGAYSVPGGSADFMNNVESVFIPAGVSGNFLARVTAHNINSVGVPNSNSIPCQDFALIIYNATPQPFPVMSAAGSTLVSESCMPTNGVVDPGETVTVSFALQNIGTTPTSNLVATLLTNSGVVSPSAPQTYGALQTNDTPVAQSFTFKAVGTCGGNITATLQLKDGTNNLGTVNFTFGLGQFVASTTFVENFDEVTAPALSSGWTSIATGAESNWVTTTNKFDSGTNSVFAPDTNATGLTQLVSPVIPIVTTNAQLSFMNWYDLEAYPSESSTPTEGFDGGVLDISIAGGSFQDIIAAGGSFSAGGYNTSIVSPDNALNGRAAWSGNSGQFISTVVNLPASAAGQNIQLRWSCGTDSTNVYGGTGWYVDTISILDGYYDCCVSPAAPLILNPQINNTNFVFYFQSVGGQSYTVQSTTNLAPPNWTNLQSFTGTGATVFITNNASAPRNFYRLISP